MVTIVSHSSLIVCCYHQPSPVDVTLLTTPDHLLHKYLSVSLIICGNFNLHESTGLLSSHTSSAGTATSDICESRGLHQLINFPTRFNVILDLVFTECPGSTQLLLNLNTSDHVAIVVILSSLTNVITPANH